MILPYELVFTDLGPTEDASYRFVVDRSIVEEEAIALMAPRSIVATIRL